MTEIKHWLVPDWPAPANIHAATTLRTGGVSQGIFSSLNPAIHVSDDNDLVKKNRQIITEMLDLPAEPVWLEQIHSNRAVKAVKTASLQQADASYTNESGVVCAVLTADCLPLLVCSGDGTQVAAIHAGWRGLLTGVIGNTVDAMQSPLKPPLSKEEARSQFQNADLSSPLCKKGGRADFLVWLGPAIGPDRFEVGFEVRDAFMQKSAAFNDAFKQQSNDKWLADIYQLARIELAALGVVNVYGGTHCTVTEHERFYSYRRESQTGRMATLIWRE
ncbi:polyphenol oxidase family protein [Methylobacter sp. S3L5C]|uniref:polyphenol oxidase family protein n=1 Tax=Methylobacter sp. S3L5C TaxID=2839024 RepID=UPI001FACC260|nr:laccase domain-containing protein [Methylobacter sp. S3L5C]UOA09218.1 laccase domain-containing protein [Methylobacter sp. S3L5C]